MTVFTIEVPGDFNGSVFDRSVDYEEGVLKGTHPDCHGGCAVLSFKSFPTPTPEDEMWILDCMRCGQHTEVVTNRARARQNLIRSMASRKIFELKSPWDLFEGRRKMIFMPK